MGKKSKSTKKTKAVKDITTSLGNQSLNDILPLGNITNKSTLLPDHRSFPPPTQSYLQTLITNLNADPPNLININLVEY